MTNVFSALKPTGSLHLGNYLGAIRPMVALQNDPTHDCRYAIADLHSLTVEHDPRQLGPLTRRLATLLFASGIDPVIATVFVQSHVAAHAELAYLMEATARVGELRRMAAFKEKALGRDRVRLALFTYPALMAADILAYDTDVVPVGDDQRQHLELARTLAERFNSSYGTTFVVPEGFAPGVGARVMDLTDPTQKMGKTSSTTAGAIGLLDPPDVIAHKVSRATTDTYAEVRHDAATQPGVTNLLEILGALTDEPPQTLAASYRSYAQLKGDVTAVVTDALRPVQKRYVEYADEPGRTDALLRIGAERAADLARPVIERARRAIGLVA